PRPDELKHNVGLGGGYTTNPALRSNSVGSNGDSTSELRAALMDRRSSPRTDWSAKYDSFYTRYGSNNQFDTINHALNFDGRYLVSRRTHVNLFEHFFYSRNPLQIGGAAPADETIILTRLTHRWRSISDAEFDTSVSRSLTLQVGASSRGIREGERQNRLTAGATLHHPFRRVDFISGYRRSLDADAGVATVTVAQNAYAGMSGTVGRTASLGVFAEYGTRDSVLETGDQIALTYTGGAIRGSIALDPRFSISGEARRRKQTAAEGAGEDLTVDTLFLGLVFQVF